jgi:hypothetical protein
VKRRRESAKDYVSNFLLMAISLSYREGTSIFFARAPFFVSRPSERGVSGSERVEGSTRRVVYENAEEKRNHFAFIPRSARKRCELRSDDRRRVRRAEKIDGLGQAD